MTTIVSGSSITFNDNTTQNTSAYGGGFAFRNRIINGDMRIDQRNAGAAVTVNNTDSLYTLDRFLVFEQADGVFSVQQVSTAPNGFTNSLQVTTTTADASLASNQYSGVAQQIEGYNISDLAWGTASAKTVTLSFWVRSSLTGTFGGSLRNSAADRSYPFSYTISAANTWEYKTVTIAGDTTGTWLTTNGKGITLTFGLGVGTDNSGTAGAWVSANILSSTGAVSVLGTLNATWNITGVQLEKGSTATSFDYRPYGQELALCQRYYYRVNGNGTTQTAMSFGGYSSSSTLGVGFNQFPVTMRIAPTAMEQSGTASHYAWRGTGSNVTFSGVPTWSDVTTENLAVYTGTVSSGLTSGQSIYTRALSNSAFLAWSAEL